MLIVEHVLSPILPQCAYRGGKKNKKKTEKSNLLGKQKEDTNEHADDAEENARRNQEQKQSCLWCTTKKSIFGRTDRLTWGFCWMPAWNLSLRARKGQTGPQSGSSMSRCSWLQSGCDLTLAFVSYPHCGVVHYRQRSAEWPELENGEHRIGCTFVNPPFLSLSRRCPFLPSDVLGEQKLFLFKRFR